jgi:hypothetical protein
MRDDRSETMVQLQQKEMELKTTADQHPSALKKSRNNINHELVRITI